LEYQWFGRNRKTTLKTVIFIVNMIGINRNNRDNWSYPDLALARTPVLNLDLVPVPSFRELPQLSEDESCMSDIAQGKESGGSDRDFQTTSLVNVLTRMN
jgi:hypothetical protein